MVTMKQKALSILIFALLSLGVSCESKGGAPEINQNSPLTSNHVRVQDSIDTNNTEGGEGGEEQGQVKDKSSDDNCENTFQTFLGLDKQLAENNNKLGQFNNRQKRLISKNQRIQKTQLTETGKTMATNHLYNLRSKNEQILANLQLKRTEILDSMSSASRSWANC